ncbi:MAG: hypothetical protein NC131_20475 [Roseburia sp.]|nr:hypothetical protein [Roseburia sp.]
MNNSSKPISKIDDASKQMQIDALKGDQGHGFDIDTIYYVEGVWYVFEYLKCENEYVSPYSSDPARYPWNWRKFHSLFQITKQLNGKLILVNYSTRDKDKDEVKVMIVKNVKYDLLRNYIENSDGRIIKYLEYIEYEQVYKFSFSEYSDWLRRLNSNSEIFPL